MNKDKFCKVGISLIGLPALANMYLILLDVKAPQLMGLLMELCFLGIAIATYCGFGSVREAQTSILHNQGDILAAAKKK